ncbi:hypothetical protein POM88_050181 [Heracleum sosnowskyi]|uniref:hAT-like transposase RNase-H fold domain-containing protein n=1 Tax=Heracleum sosnowskyi TaxID=360622 RepID=A0AAD8M054_9APIA|nr:hypothetical protein POM88_050181 [Heracleum sosnowskyi]
MLESALKFKKAFANLMMTDATFVKEMKKVGGDITAEEWKQMSTFLTFLKVFYDATLKLSGALYVTSNYYIDVIFGVGFVLSQHLHHEDEIVRKMAAHMKLKYEKYWGNIDKLNLFMFIFVILDPRRKMVYVDWMIKAWFGIERAENLSLNIKSTFSSLFEFYASSMSDPNITAKSRSSSSTYASSFQSKDKENEKMFDFSEFLGSTFEIEVGGGISEKKVEWERYLEDERESNESCPNVLQWWKDNKNRMVEALICGQDWLRTSNRPFIIEESLLELEKLEEGMENLTVEQPVILIDETVDDI